MAGEAHPSKNFPLLYGFQMSQLQISPDLFSVDLVTNIFDQ